MSGGRFGISCFQLKSTLTLLLSVPCSGGCPLGLPPLGFLAHWRPSRSSNVRKEDVSRELQQREFGSLFHWLVLSEAAFLGSRSLGHHSLVHGGCSLFSPFWVVMDFSLLPVPGCHCPGLVLNCAHHAMYSSLVLLFKLLSCV